MCIKIEYIVSAGERYAIDIMSCLSRITDETHAQYFGNGHNKFYIEFRCNLPCIRGSSFCLKCAGKSDTCKIQSSRKFQHGNINEPIPDASHIFGGSWYHKASQKYGTPSEDVILFALKHQQQARQGFDPSLYAAAEEATATTTAAAASAAAASAAAASSPLPKKKKSSKATPTKEESKEEVPSATSVAPPKVQRQAKAKKPKTPINPYSSLVQQNTALVYKEVSLPTHIEKSIEELDTDDCDIEYVTLQPYEVQGTLYFRDSKKNKLYKNVKNKIGDYVGRYDPDKEIIHTDLPDSDAED
jgi:hypothetical protein